MTKRMFDEATGTGWKINPKNHEHGGWTYYKDHKPTEGGDDGSFLSREMAWNTYKKVWNELLIKPTGKLMNATGIGSQFFSYDRKKDEWGVRPYRENPIGSLHTVGELTIRAAKALADKSVYAPGTAKTVEQNKNDLRIERQNKINALKNKEK